LDKLAAPLRGKALLQHVVDAAADARLAPIVVVLAAVRTGVDWRGARPVLNPDPERGLSSSLRLGLEALAAESDAERVVVLLGDQPLVSTGVIARLLEVWGRPIVVPRYADGRPGNPVVIGRAAWPLARGISGDPGMSQLFGSRPDLVAYIDVAGTNPDVDTPADLEALN
jgi:molybdenum cofactor cytidylyltransferase